MEAVEFIRKIQKMCAGADCDVCPLNDKNGCNVCCAEDPVESVRIVEEWAAEQERQKAEQEPEQEKRLREMEEEIRLLRAKTQKLIEISVMHTKSFDVLQEMMEEARKEIRLVDAFSLRLVETECNERVRMEKQLTERIEELERGEH